MDYYISFECYNMFIIEPLKAELENNVDGPNEDLNDFLENLEPL